MGEMCEHVCVGVYGVHAGPWCSRDARRMASLPLGGQTRGSDTGQPPSARSRDTKGTKTLRQAVRLPLSAARLYEGHSCWDHM